MRSVRNPYLRAEPFVQKEQDICHSGQKMRVQIPHGPIQSSILGGTVREYIRIARLREGDIAGETLYDDSMRVLLRTGNKLTARGISMIEHLGYKGIYISNQESIRREDVPLAEPIIDNETFLRMVAESKDALKNVIEGQSPVLDLVHTMAAYVEELVNLLKEREAMQDMLYETQDMRMLPNWIFYHSIATSVLSAGIAITLHMPDERVKSIALGGLLHDMGKAFLGPELYQKADITEEERLQLRDHPELMFRILQRETTLPVDTLYAVWQHHEKSDGSGYPNGLTLDKTHISAQIVGLSSTFDNLTNITPFNRHPMKGEEALEYLSGCGLYPAEHIQALRHFACIYSVGTTVKLSDGRFAIVLKNIQDYPQRPYLLCGKEILDLSHDQNLLDLVIEKEI